MNKKITILGIGALVLTGLMLGTSNASAYQGDPSVKGPYYTEERHEAMTQAFDNTDYNAWKELMGDRGRVTEVVTEENFSRFAEAHRLAQEGDLEGARQIRQELGLQMGNMNRMGNGRGWNK